MNKKDIKYYSIILAILIATIVFETMKPKPIDWRFTLEAKDKIPYGTYVLKQTIKDIFPNKRIYTNKKTTYQYINSISNKKDIKNYIYISNDFNVDKLETKTILNLAEKGNNIFISAHYFSDAFSDTLKFSTRRSGIFDTTTNLNFYNKSLKRKKDYYYSKIVSNIHFSKFDTTNVKAIAFSDNNEIVIIKQKVGNGNIFINTTPEIFTNYAMITENNYEFAYKALSYLPIKNVVFDEYYKPFRKSNKSLLSVIYEMPGLKTAYILMLITVIFFVFFTAKRRQRIIPIIKPYENKTLEFVETIGRVYFNSKNHKDIAEKKYQYFCTFLLQKYNINIINNESVNYDFVSEKTTVDIDTIKKLLLSYNKINKLEKISAEQLNKFNNYIEDFYDKCK